MSPNFSGDAEEVRSGKEAGSGQRVGDSTISEAALTLSTAPIWSTIPRIAYNSNWAVEQREIPMEK